MKGIVVKRKEAGVSQTQLAEICGVSQAAVAAWESGAKNPTADKLPIIADALGCSIDDLYRTEQPAEQAG